MVAHFVRDEGVAGSNPVIPIMGGCYVLSRNTTDNSLILKEFDVETVHDLLRIGNPVIPLWLDRIHQELRNNITRLKRFKQDNQTRART